METEPTENGTPDDRRDAPAFDVAIPVGSTEAAQLADRVQNNEMGDLERGPSRTETEVSDADANKAIAEVYAMLCDAKAAQGPAFEHWRADEEEKALVRDNVAPSVKEIVPNSVLANSKHLVAVGTLGKLLLSKKAQDPE